MSDMPARPTHVVITPTKSMGTAIMLTFLFGPLGLLYASILGGLVMMVVSFVVAVATLGLGLLLTWPICIVWAGVAVKMHNEKLVAGTKVA